MVELPRRLLAWLARLLPQQKAWGDHTVQVGQVRGDLHMDRSTHSSTSRHSSAVHVTRVTHQHFYAAPPAPVQAQAQATATDTPRLSPEQREVFSSMRCLPQHEYHLVLAFMRRQWGTDLVAHLNDRQLYRTRRYVETVRHNRERSRCQAPGQ